MPIPFTIPELAAICFSATLTENLTGTALHGALQEAIDISPLPRTPLRIANRT